MAMPPIPVTYEFESVLYDITPPTPTNQSSDPCVVVHLQYTYRRQVKFQSNVGDDEVVLLEEPELHFLFSIPLGRLITGDYKISHVLERTNKYLEPCECEYLKAQISEFAASLLLSKSNNGHQRIEMVVLLQSSKVVCTEKKLTESPEHYTPLREDEDLMEGAGDNFDLFVSSV